MPTGGLTFTTGVLFTVTVTFFVAGQLPVVPVIVYVVLATGLASTDEPVVALSPPEGLHVYAVAPVTLNVTPVSPVQILADAGFAVKVGVGLTLIIDEAVSLHPPCLPVTV